MDTDETAKDTNGLGIKVIVARGATVGATFFLIDGTNLIGRWDPDSGAFPEIDLEPHDPEAKISRRHAVLEVIDRRVFIEDIGSLNGTFINRGTRLKLGDKHELQNGDELVIGKTFLRLEFEIVTQSV